ncbi:DNA-binding response regulator [Streptomyces sp. NPDC018347]|uniref:response regulator transcription factor n=1 Tax=Streptomyces sp. NPDC018347 TaxID=3157193 RepID=UPI0033DD118B
MIRLLGAHGHDVVAAVDNGAEPLRALGRERPDVAVVDVRLPPDFTDEGLRAALAARLRARKERDASVGSPTGREREVLELLAEGRSDAGIAQALCITEKAVAEHIGNIFTRLGLLPADADNRRVPAVLACLGR